VIPPLFGLEKNPYILSRSRKRCSESINEVRFSKASSEKMEWSFFETAEKEIYFVI